MRFTDEQVEQMLQDCEVGLMPDPPRIYGVLMDLLAARQALKAIGDPCPQCAGTGACPWGSCEVCGGSGRFDSARD